MTKPQKTFRSLSDLADLEQISEQTPAIISASLRKHDGKGKNVRVLLDTHGRKGKTVTIVSGLQHNPTTLEDIARTLKQHCGAGGTVKNGTIEIQGDQRTRITEKLKELNYTVK
jgi:translation initiation factor 1